MELGSVRQMLTALSGSEFLCVSSGLEAQEGAERTLDLRASETMQGAQDLAESKEKVLDLRLQLNKALARVVEQDEELRVLKSVDWASKLSATEKRLSGTERELEETLQLLDGAKREQEAVYMKWVQEQDHHKETCDASEELVQYKNQMEQCCSNITSLRQSLLVLRRATGTEPTEPPSKKDKAFFGSLLAPENSVGEMPPAFADMQIRLVEAGNRIATLQVCLPSLMCCVFSFFHDLYS